ncbi:MAG: hypothetical protein WCG85_12105 [Polyangia bacterium]
MKIQIATLVVLLSAACNSRSGLRTTRDASADGDPGAGGPATDTVSAADALRDAIPLISPDTAATDGAAEVSASGEETLDADHDDADAPTDSLPADLQSIDALASPCGVPVTGSCLYDGFCTDYTDTDLPVAMGDCNQATSSLGTWSTQPCQDRFTEGCLYGTPGVPGCQVAWAQRGIDYQIDCLHYGGTPVSP